MSRTYTGKKIDKIKKNKNGEWEVCLEDGMKIVFYSDGMHNPVTDCYISTKDDRPPVIPPENPDKDDNYETR